MRKAAEDYHGRCVKLLIDLKETEIRSEDGTALAAVCLLRSYEILAEETDPNRHLSGAYALASSQSVDFGTPTLLRAGFFNFLREDITFSLMRQTPLKMDLTGIDTSTYVPRSDEDQLNIVTLLLAGVINEAFSASPIPERLATLETQLRAWQASLPKDFEPFSTTVDSGDATTFPSIWMLQDCHVAVRQYYLVAKSLLEYCAARFEYAAQLHSYAAELCGLAFTSGSTAVLVNSFGPFSFCCRFLTTQRLRSESVRRLIACRKETGWPVQRLIEDLEQHWRITLSDG